MSTGGARKRGEESTVALGLVVKRETGAFLKRCWSPTRADEKKANGASRPSKTHTHT